MVRRFRPVVADAWFPEIGESCDEVEFPQLLCSIHKTGSGVLERREGRERQWRGRGPLRFRCRTVQQTWYHRPSGDDESGYHGEDEPPGTPPEKPFVHFGFLIPWFLGCFRVLHCKTLFPVLIDWGRGYKPSGSFFVFKQSCDLSGILAIRRRVPWAEPGAPAAFPSPGQKSPTP